MALTPPRYEGSLRLPDGRRMGFAEFGDPHGRAILWFHGIVGGRRQIPDLAREIAHHRGIRLIGVERPGVGDSSGHLYDSLIDYADDMRVLADHLGIERFGVIGLSGGGPYVLACAAALPDRVVAGCVLGGVAPTRGAERAEGGLIDLATRFSGAIELLQRPIGAVFSLLMKGMAPAASEGFDQFIKIMPAGDQAVFRRPEMKEMFIEDMLDASKVGLRSLVNDLILFTRPWGFELAEIEVPIRFWQGDADPIVPLEHGHHQADLVPDSRITIRPAEGHMGSFAAADEILESILEVWPDEEAGVAG